MSSFSRPLGSCVVRRGIVHRSATSSPSSSDTDSSLGSVSDGGSSVASGQSGRYSLRSGRSYSGPSNSSDDARDARSHVARSLTPSSSSSSSDAGSPAPSPLPPVPATSVAPFVCNNIDDIFRHVSEGDDSDYYDSDLMADEAASPTSSSSDDSTIDEYDAIRRFHVRPTPEDSRVARHVVRGKYALDVAQLPDNMARSFKKAGNYFTDEISTARDVSKGPVTQVWHNACSLDGRSWVGSAASLSVCAAG